MFVIQTVNGEEIQATNDDLVMISPTNGVLTVHRKEGSERVTTHYSPAAWQSITHRATKEELRQYGSGAVMGNNTIVVRG